MKRLFLLVFVSVGMLAGCSGAPRPDGFPKLYPVTLTIQQDGQPLAGAMVMLIPSSPQQWGVGGTTDAQGKVNIRTHGQHDGAPEGNYAVVITKRESVSPVPIEIRNGTIQQQEEWNRKNPTARVAIFNLIEAEFQSAETTPLKINVERKTVHQTLDAGKAVRIPVVTRGFM